MGTPPKAEDETRIAAIRQFNRFYTRRIGVLERHLLESPFTLTEARVLFELAHRDGILAKDIGTELGLDPGYLSRIVQSFMKKGLVTRKPEPSDRRQFKLALTAKGRQAFDRLDRTSHQEVGKMIAELPGDGGQRLVEAMSAIERLLDDETHRPDVALRAHRPGDMGWVVQQHGEIYAREYGWNSEFEALVADIVAKYLRHYQPAWEHCWMAELDGQRVGSVFVVRKSRTVAQLRMLILAPQARGLGLGARLTDQCIAFARDKGYKKMVLWTNSCLGAARDIYARRGFKLVKSEPYHGFGQDLVGEHWELKL